MSQSVPTPYVASSKQAIQEHINRLIYLKFLKNVFGELLSSPSVVMTGLVKTTGSPRGKTTGLNVNRASCASGVGSSFGGPKNLAIFACCLHGCLFI